MLELFNDRITSIDESNPVMIPILDSTRFGPKVQFIEKINDSSRQRAHRIPRNSNFGGQKWLNLSEKIYQIVGHF